MSEDSTSDADDARADTGDSPSAADDSTPAGAGRTLDVHDSGRFVLYVLAPAALGTAVYWVVTDATLVQIGLFGVVMVVVILAMDSLFDTIPSP